MKNIYSWSVILIAVIVTLSSCDNSLEIVPKGKSTLNSLEDLELLLNQDYHLDSDPSQDLCILIDESYTPAKTVDGILSDKYSLLYAYLAYDESVDRVTLTPEDNRFQMLYKYIHFMNVVIGKANDIKGDEQVKLRLIAEAKVMRAYLHFLTACFHAGQYDSDTAEKSGGIGYVTDYDVTTPKEKYSLALCFDKMLEDCSEENIGKLSQGNSDPCRVDMASGFAIRAKILFQMKRYDEAMRYAGKALELNDEIEDRSVIKSTGMWALPESAPNNYIFIRGMMQCNPTYIPTTPATTSKFESGDYTLKYCTSGWSDFYGNMFSGVSGSLAYSGWDTYGNPYGLKVEHMYYIMAECHIRKGNIVKGLEYVDKVRAKRVEDFEPFATRPNLDEKTAMTLLQDAKLIEFFAGCENFLDRKRWNSEAAYRKDIVRDLGVRGKFTLKPESPLWIMPFPENAIRYNKLLTQNY